MELRYLLSFVTVVECQGFTRAAQKLGLTQAGVSKQIAALEAAVGVPLLARQGRSVQATSAGMRLYGHARKILDLVDAVRRDLGMMESAVNGTLCIAASTVPAQSLVPELVARFHELYPLVRESITVSDSFAATRAVLEGRADVGVVGELPDSPHIQAKAIAEDELVLVVSPKHRLAAAGKITPAHLRREALIVRETGSGSQRCLERALDAAGLSLGEMTIAMEMNSNEAICGAVERGAGAAFLSRVIIARAVAEKKLVVVPVAGLRLKRHLYLISDSRRVLPAAGRAFLEFAGRWTARRRPVRKARS